MLPSADTLHMPWRDEGVYLITGGAGSLGLLFAKEIANRTSRSTIVLTGRSVLSEDKENELEALRSIGAEVVYREADVSDQHAARHLLRKSKKNMALSMELFTVQAALKIASSFIKRMKSFKKCCSQK